MDFRRKNYKDELDVIYKEYGRVISVEDRDEQALEKIERTLKKVRKEMCAEKEIHLSKIRRIINWLTDYKQQDEKLFNQKANTLNSIFAVLIGSVLLVDAAFPDPDVFFLSMFAGGIGLIAVFLMLGKKMLFKNYGSKLEEVVMLNTLVQDIETELAKLEGCLSQVNWVVTSTKGESHV